MALESDPMLKQLVQQQLTSNGILPKLKAQLRAHVFLALESNSEFSKLNGLNTEASELLKTDKGVLAVSLVREFLQHLGLEFTLSVFDNEIEAITQPAYLERSELSSRLGCETSLSEPILIQMLGSKRKISACATPINPLNSTYVKNDEASPQRSSRSMSTQSVEEEEEEEEGEETVEDEDSAAGCATPKNKESSSNGCVTPSNNKNDESINLLMFTPVAVPKSQPDPQSKASIQAPPKTDKSSKNSLLGDLPPLIQSSSSNNSDIRRLLHDGLAKLQNTGVGADDYQSHSSTDSPSEKSASIVDETCSKITDADVTDTVSSL